MRGAGRTLAAHSTGHRDKRDKFNSDLNGLKNSGRNQMYAHDSPICAETNWRTTDVTDISIGGRDAK